MSEFQYLDGGNDEAQDRLATSFLFAQDSTGLVTDGVLTGLAVAQTGTASASVLIAAGAGIVQDTVLNGVALMVNDTQKTLDVLTAWPMGGTPRNDLVVFDSATKTIRPIQGTPNAVPTDPAVPSTAFPLARLRHAASATTVPTSAIDDLRTFTTLAAAASDANKLGVTSTMAGKRIHRQDYIGGTTDANGFLTVNHTAGFTPTLVTVHSTAPSASFAIPWGTDTYTSTQARVRFSDPRSTAPTSGAYASASTGAFSAIFWE